MGKSSFLTHQFLVATPDLQEDFFAQTLIYIVRHEKQGALGLIINKPSNIDIRNLMDDLDIPTDSPLGQPALVGGPVHPEVGFVLHTGNPDWHASFAVSENVCITTSKDILNAIARHEGVQSYQLILGFSGWSTEQLEQEIARGDWLLCPVDQQLLFHVPYTERWQVALDKIGVRPAWFAGEMGHA